jgi:hypothetical protein
MISGFTFPEGFTFGNIGPWCSALITLPSLERVTFGLREPETEDQRVLLNVEPFKELLCMPALRVVNFYGFYFTNELCHATANALEEGPSIVHLTFENQCTFPDGGTAIIANALKRNVTVTGFSFIGDFDELFCNTLAAVLLSNSTLQYLNVWATTRASGRWLPSIFLSLGLNTTFKCLITHISGDFGDELCAAITSGLSKNTTLEKLSLDEIIPIGDDGAISARNALSFVRTNSTLKSLNISFLFMRAQKESLFVSAFRLEAVKMLENTFLKSLTIPDYYSGSSIQVEEFLALISALQLNTTLKTLGFQSSCFANIHFTDDEVNQLVSVLLKNYGLECLVPDIRVNDGRVKAILRLNGAGRQYLIKDGSSRKKGVDVLSAVSNYIDCVFLHLLENPSLCDRRAAETTPGRLRLGANLDEASGAGKRERSLLLQLGTISFSSAAALRLRRRLIIASMQIVHMMYTSNHSI